MARPQKLNEATRRIVLSAVLNGAPLQHAARAAGCSVRTAQRLARRDSAFAFRLDTARKVSVQHRRWRRAAGADQVASLLCGLPIDIHENNATKL